MKLHKIGVIMNGVTGRMGTNQHLIRSILAIQKQGGIKINKNAAIMPEPVLVGRNQDKLQKLAEDHGLQNISTNLTEVLADPKNKIYFDSQSTKLHVDSMLMAIDAGKAVYCEKPTADSLEKAIQLYQAAERAGVKNGVVQDKLFLPGLQKFMKIKQQGFLGEILSVHGEFGYWVFSGHNPEQPPQRPSWNYRSEDGGGIIVDMHSHWRYVIDNLFGQIKSVLTHAETHLKERVDENGKIYTCTADDAAYAIFKTEDNVLCQFNSSWVTRVRRDDLFTMLVNGTEASALIGLRKCWLQKLSSTPRFIWNPDVDSSVDPHNNWKEILATETYDNAFKNQWELFLRHVVLDEPFPWNLREGAKGVQLAEKSLQSHQQRRWVELEELPN